MTLYEFLLFIHISATVVWVGAGLCSLVLAIRKLIVHPEPIARAGRGARGAGTVGRLGQPTDNSLVTVVSAWSITVRARSTSSSLTVSGGAMRRQFAEPAL
jgi:hypothetical protein